jgi:hypothetical protein
VGSAGYGNKPNKPALSQQTSAQKKNIEKRSILFSLLAAFLLALATGENWASKKKHGWDIPTSVVRKLNL